ncbi:hypothetical protein IG631_06992 [Alternaria alternata]|nr:hypothetical protein IG631_06992 [Alternaria alternata]
MYLFSSHVNAPSTCQDARWLGRSMKDLRGECEDGKEKSDLGCTSVSPFCFRSTHQAATPSTPSPYINRAAGSTRILIVEPGRSLPAEYAKKATGSGIRKASEQ